MTMEVACCSNAMPQQWKLDVATMEELEQHNALTMEALQQCNTLAMMKAGCDNDGNATPQMKATIAET